MPLRERFRPIKLGGFPLGGYFSVCDVAWKTPATDWVMSRKVAEIA